MNLLKYALPSFRYMDEAGNEPAAGGPPPFNPFVGADDDDEDLEGLDYGNEIPGDQDPGDGDAAAPGDDNPPANDPSAAPAPTGEDEGANPEGGEGEGDEEIPDQPGDAESDDPDEDAQRSDPKTENRIPKSRFDEVNERRKLAEKRLAELEAEAAAKQGDFDFDGKEEEYMHAVVDGDFAKAKQIRTEIRNAEKALFQSEASSGDQKTVKQIKAELKFDQAVDGLQTQFPFLNPEHKGYDADLVDEILDLHGAFVWKGYDLDVAITKATNYVIKANGLDKPAEKAEGKPDDQGDKPKVTPKPADPAANRKKAQAASTQPPSMDTGTSDRGAKPVDLGSMSEEEFDALPESKRRELRGDFL